MLIWILAGVAVALIPLIVIAVSADRKYRRLFRDDHLAELAALLERLRTQAEADDAEATDLTSLALAVTWRPRGPEVVLSHGSGKLARPAAAFLLAWVHALLGLAEARCRFVEAGGRFTLRVERLPEGAEVTVVLPDAGGLHALRAAAADTMGGVAFTAS